MIRLGTISELTRYPVKSMAGVRSESALLGVHGLAGDRRFAFRRTTDDGGSSWLTASRLPELLLYHPLGFDETAVEPIPTHVRTPSGARLEIVSPELQREISEKCGLEVRLMRLASGIFDESPISVISRSTIAGIGTACGVPLDRRRFRANIVVDTLDTERFCEDAWVGGTLVFGEGTDAPALRVTKRDVRCMIINLDPDTAKQDGRVLRRVVELNSNNAGVYATVLRLGPIHVGDAAYLV